MLGTVYFAVCHIYSLFQAVSLLSWGWVVVGGSIITRFKAKSVELDWTGLELNLAIRVFYDVSIN